MALHRAFRFRQEKRSARPSAIEKATENESFQLALKSPTTSSLHSLIAKLFASACSKGETGC
jgi:hypothetical protein